jgi:Holliday junction resolvase
MRQRAAKRDTNERAIIDALEEAGCVVQQVSAPGFCDLVVWKKSNGLLRLIEVKRPKARLTLKQLESFPRWPVWIVRSPEEALQAVEARW